MGENTLYERAQRNVKSRKKFLRHVITWVVMSVFFILLNLSVSNYFWAIFPILGWGIGVAFHGIQVFSNEWEDVEIEKEYERLRKRHQEMNGSPIEDEISSGPSPMPRSIHDKSWRDQDFV